MPRRKVRQRDAQLSFEALNIEGGLLSPEWLAKVAQLQAGHQAEADYRIPKGLNLRDEIGRYWRIAQAHWNEFQSGLKAGAEPQALAERFAVALLRDAFGFGTLTKAEPVELGGRVYPIGHHAVGGRVPVVVAAATSGLDTLVPAFGDGSRRRSAFGLAQEYVNADERAAWALATDGATLRIVRDNASLTRPAWIEADLGRIFAEGRYADFAALWLLAHETRFGEGDHPVSDCPLETWRGAGREEGTRAREHLRRGVEEALVALGRGFLVHADNEPLRTALHDGKLTKDAFFQELLRLVYRLIFLLTAEERGLLQPEGSGEPARKLYADGYGLRRLRDRAVKRSAHDRFSDLWEGLKIVLRGVARGEPRLALPALGGLFDTDQCPHLDAAKLENRALLAAVFKLSWLREDSGLSRVNWRDMGPEELGSVYESLLELVPIIAEDGRGFSFAVGDETKGNARKTTGSYYTPDSLVQVLLDSALEPVVQQTIAAEPEHPAEALLQLSVIDPACGSGHFLLAAARRLAAHVARLQADGTPSAAEYRHALRQVVSRCVFGVDLNPMAVELCRVSLWMEAVEPGRPLSFLDSHIQQGNALLGATPELMAKGVPDAAWEPIEGDDKKTASLLKKKNKAAAEGQRGLDALWSKPASAESADVEKAVAELEAAPDADLAAVESKEARWEKLQASAAFRHQKFVADAWCAAFVWPKPPTEPKKVDPIVVAAPTNDLWRQIRDGQGTTPPLTTKTVGELASQYQFLHWHLAFPQVHARGGFDAVLGNPPWDSLRFSEEEFFAGRRADIAQAPTAAKRKRLIAALESEDPALYEAYRSEVRAVAGANAFVRSGVRYPLCGVGRVNLFALFAEAARALVCERGRVGQILPSGIVFDDSTKLFFQAVIDNRELVSFVDFENREGLFPAVDSRMKFGVLTLSGSPTTAGATEFVFFASRVEHLADAARRFALTAADIALLNPATKTCPIFRSSRDAELTKTVYRRAPVLSASGWKLELRRLINQSDDSGSFQEGPGAKRLPLYEGKYFHHFDHRWVTNDGEADRPLTANERLDPTLAIRPRYWYPEDEAIARFGTTWNRPWVLAFRDITNATNERTFIAAVVPSLAIPNTAKVVFTADDHVAALPGLIANFSAFAFDFVARQKVGGTHMATFIAEQLPVLSPKTYEGAASWATGQPLTSWLFARVLELTYTAWDLAPFAKDIGYDGPPLRWDPDRRFLLRAELDAAFFHLYGISREDTDYIMETFPIVRKNDEKAHAGVYRTKVAILNVYDVMAEAIRTGKPYQSRLDPPPADPRVAHPARTPTRRVKPAKVEVLPDAVWERPQPYSPADVGVVLAAVLKALGRPSPTRQVRLAVILAMDARLVLSMAATKEGADWHRLVGRDADPLPKKVTTLVPRADQAWGKAVSQLRANGLLVEDLQANTWAPGEGLHQILTEGWPDGRARWVVDLIMRRGDAEVLRALPVETRRLVDETAA